MAKQAMCGTARALAGLALAAGSAVSAATAANGDIPIFQATTITQPGRYVVTRDITAQGDVLVVQAGGVSIDLNGHTIRAIGGNGVVLDVAGSGSLPAIRVANGTIKGGGTGILGVALPAVTPVVIDKVAIVMPMFHCINLPAVRLEVRGSVLSECEDGIRMEGGGLIEVRDTLISDTRGSGIFADTVDGITVRESTFRRFGGVPGIYGHAGIWALGFGKVGLSVFDSVLCDGGTMSDGIRMWPPTTSAPIRIVGNQIAGNLGNGINLGSTAGHITGNTLVGNGLAGIHIDAAGIVTPTMISGNSIQRNGTDGATVLAGVVRFNGNTVGGNGQDGVRIAGERSLVESNFLEGNTGAGIRFLNANGHAFRSNFLRGNTGGAVDDQFGNTDAGGNIQ